MAGNIRLAANGKVNRMRDFIREFLQNPLATVPYVLAAVISAVLRRFAYTQSSRASTVSITGWLPNLTAGGSAVSHLFSST